MRKHDRLEAAVRAGGEQFKRASAIELGAAPAVFCWLFGVRGPQRRHDYSHRLSRAFSPPAFFHQYMPRLRRGARQENINSLRRPVKPPPDTVRRCWIHLSSAEHQPDLCLLYLPNNGRRRMTWTAPTLIESRIGLETSSSS